MFPDGLSKDSREEEIKGVVSKEYSVSEDYRSYKEKLEKMWQEFSPKFEEIKKISKLHLQNKYIVALSKYGTGGSYHTAESSIDIRFIDREVVSIFGTILHEIVHISIEPLIVKYDIEHWQKERLVDLIGLAYFPDHRKPQDIKEDVSRVDASFHKYFPDIEDVIKNI